MRLQQNIEEKSDKLKQSWRSFLMAQQKIEGKKYKLKQPVGDHLRKDNMQSSLYSFNSGINIENNGSDQNPRDSDQRPGVFHHSLSNKALLYNLKRWN